MASKYEVRISTRYHPYDRSQHQPFSHKDDDDDEVVFQKIHPNAQLPTIASRSAAGLDLYSLDTLIIPPWEQVLVKTGLSILKYPGNTYGRIAPRSGLAYFHQLGVNAGVIDSDYKGEIKILLINFSYSAIPIPKGTRVAQIIFEKYAALRKITNQEKEQPEETTEQEHVREKQGFGQCSGDVLKT